MKTGMAARFRVVQLIPGIIEKNVERDSSCPYQEPTQVSLGKKPKASRGTVGKGTRQISHVR